MTKVTIAGREWPIANGRANLLGADLKGANLEDANLKGADLEGANLEDANLKGADLKSADLLGAYLEDANLKGADLEGANLEEADLKGANLLGANLLGANLEGANLEGAYLRDANGVHELDMADPRGYRPVAVAHADGWRISSGCRWFTVQEAIAHWSNPKHETPAIAARYIRAINALPECRDVEERAAIRTPESIYFALP
jgi:hypothetical protein